LFSIDFQNRTPIYEQIVNQVEKFIMVGILKEGEQLPSVRQVASDLGINPNTIQKAYSELENKKMIVSVLGKGNFVGKNIENIKENKKQELIKRIKNDVKELENLGVNVKDILNI